MLSSDRSVGNIGDTLLLHIARKLAREDGSDWYIVTHQKELFIAKLIVASRLRFVRVISDDGLVLRFTSIMEAREFLKNIMSVPRAAVYLEEMDWKIDETYVFGLNSF